MSISSDTLKSVLGLSNEMFSESESLRSADKPLPRTFFCFFSRHLISVFFELSH